MGESPYCHTCYSPIDSGDECTECQRSREYWTNLTPDERKSEIQAMGDYAAEADY